MGTVISDLSKGKDKSKITFRQSKLTRLLSTSLGGNANTALICCISPAEANRDESRSTLQFASNAKKVVNRAVVNHTDGDGALITKMREEILRLQSQAQTTITIVDETTAKENEELKKKIDELQKQLVKC